MVNHGLEGVVVAETVLSRVDGEAGELVLRGRPVAEVARLGRVEAVMALLWTGDVDTAGDHQRALGRARVAMWPLVERARVALDAQEGIVALRGGLGLLETEDPHEVVAATGLMFAAWVRHRQGRVPLAPDPSLDHAADLLRMATGAHHPARAAALAKYLSTVSDHGMNASTFVARVITSTGSDPVSAVVGALGALKGPLHGGAPGPVLEMLRAVGSPERAEAWIEEELAAGRRIMGMGHRVYRVRDPRAAVLEQAAEALAAEGVAADGLRLAREVERTAQRVLEARKPGRVLRANVEFYTAVLLDAVGLDPAAFSAAFACGRVVGWLAHVEEQRRTGRLIRPRAAYVGPSTQ